MNPEQMVAMLNRHEAQIQHLSNYEEKQNGHLERVEAKIDRMTWAIMGALFTALINLGGVIVTIIVVKRG